MLIMNICDNADILSIFRIVNTVMTIIKIAVPILLIVSLMISYTSAVRNNDADALNKANKNAVPKIIAALLVFFIPSFVNTLAHTVSYDSNNYLKCIKNATPEKINELYLRDAYYYGDLAKTKLDRNYYNMAVKYTNKLLNKDDRERMEKELDYTLKLIEAEEKRKKEEEKKKQQALVKPENGWWWPIGGKASTVNGVLMSTGTPASSSITARFGGNDKVHKALKSSHGAIDIAANAKTYVIASKSGTVVEPAAGTSISNPNRFLRNVKAGDCKGLKSNTVVIKHSNGYTTTYKHLYPNTIIVRKGANVAQGQVIGQVGSSGCSTGYHLHFEIAINGTKVDPEKYVSRSKPRP